MVMGCCVALHQYNSNIKARKIIESLFILRLHNYSKFNGNRDVIYCNFESQGDVIFVIGEKYK